MIRPVFEDPTPKAKPAAAARKDDGVVSFEELPPVSINPPAAYAETAIFETSAGTPRRRCLRRWRPTRQIALCECGAEILVSKRDVGSTIQCPACADVMTVEMTSDPRTRQADPLHPDAGTLDDAGLEARRLRLIRPAPEYHFTNSRIPSSIGTFGSYPRRRRACRPRRRCASRRRAAPASVGCGACVPHSRRSDR